MRQIVRSVKVMERKRERVSKGNSNDLLMNMSHEFKTPLSAIQLNAQLLEKVVENKSGYLLKFLSKYIERILDQSKNVVSILEDTMTFMRMQNEKPTLDISIINGKDISNELTSTFSNYYPNRILEIENYSDYSIMADKATFYRAITKLITIALEANPDRKPKLVLSDSDDHLSIKLTAPNLRIKENELRRIFEPFSSLSEFNQIEALPLRLGLIRELLALNGSKIRVYLNEERNAIFSICVPRYQNKALEK